MQSLVQSLVRSAVAFSMLRNREPVVGCNGSFPFVGFPPQPCHSASAFASVIASVILTL